MFLVNNNVSIYGTVPYRYLIVITKKHFLKSRAFHQKNWALDNFSTHLSV